MAKPSAPETPDDSPGQRIRNARKQLGLTLGDISEKTGLAISTLSKLEQGQMSLSYDKLTLLSRALDVDMAELLSARPAARADVPPAARGRRVVQRVGDGQMVETRSYRQLYLVTELLHKRFTPLIAEVQARTLEDFKAEFGDLIRHPGEEFVYVLEGVIEFHSELYAPLKLKAGESMYFDSEMGHAYLKASDETCRVLACCAPRGDDGDLMATFEGAVRQHQGGG